MVYIMTAKEGVEILYKGLGQGSAHRVQEGGRCRRMTGTPKCCSSRLSIASLK